MYNVLISVFNHLLSSVFELIGYEPIIDFGPSFFGEALLAAIKTVLFG